MGDRGGRRKKEFFGLEDGDERDENPAVTNIVGRGSPVIYASE